MHKVRLRSFTACCALVAAMLLLSLQPASASTDLFYFDVDDGDFSFNLALIGSEDPGMVQIDWSGAPRPMPRRQYHVEFNRANKQLYVRPAAADGLPWFEVDVSGNQGTLLFGKRRFTGSVTWRPGVWNATTP